MRHFHGRRRLLSPAMYPARCASFFSTRLRNKNPAEASSDEMKEPAQRFAAGSGKLLRGEEQVKYICFGYYDKDRFDGMTESERNAMFDTCFEYDDHLRASGHWAGGEALQGPETALTLYWRNGKVATTDGPFAETKEQLGGILVLEARDMNHALQLISQHPALTFGNIFEVRPVADM